MPRPGVKLPQEPGWQGSGLRVIFWPGLRGPLGEKLLWGWARALGKTGLKQRGSGLPASPRVLAVLVPALVPVSSH